MEIIKGNKVRFKTPKDVYMVIAETMTGDGEGENTIKLPCHNNEDGLSRLREIIISLECCSKQNDSDNYEGLPFYNEHLYGNWHRNGDTIDHLLSYKVRYYDEEGVMYKINITNDEEMVEIITNC